MRVMAEPDQASRRRSQTLRAEDTATARGTGSCAAQPTSPESKTVAHSRREHGSHPAGIVIISSGPRRRFRAVEATFMNDGEAFSTVERSEFAASNHIRLPALIRARIGSRCFVWNKSTSGRCGRQRLDGNCTLRSAGHESTKFQPHRVGEPWTRDMMSNHRSEYETATAIRLTGTALQCACTYVTVTASSTGFELWG